MDSSSRNSRSNLGTLEEKVLRTIWTQGTCTAEDCRTALPGSKKLRESTIRTVLTRLERKGLVAHDVEGRTFVYHATHAPQTLAARAVKQIVDRFCGGSVEQMLLGLVDNSMLGKGELNRLSQEIAKRKTRKS
jgi:BlaI family penicillinase repressor